MSTGRLRGSGKAHSRRDRQIPPRLELAAEGRVPHDDDSVGAQIDGIVAEGLDGGTILAVADNPRAYLPFLQLAFESLEGATIGKR